jgi:MFS family permease
VASAIGRTRPATTAAAIGLGQTLAWASSYYLPAILADPIARDIGIPPSWIFAAFSAALLVSAALGPIVGRVIDRRGGQRVLLLSNVVFAIGLAGLAGSSSVVAIAVAWLVLGVAMSMGLYDAAFATLAGLFGAKARGPITGVTLMGGFASTVGWPVTSFLNGALGWREACLTWAALHLLIGVPVHRWLVPATMPHATGASGDPGARSVARISPLLLGLLAYVFAAGWFVATSMAAHLPRVLEAGGATPGAAVLAGALVGPAQVAARLIEFAVLHRSHPLTSARIAVILHPVGALLFAGLSVPAACFAILHGAGNGLITIAVGTLPLALFGAAGYGFRQGLLGTPARVAQATAPFVFAIMLDRLGVGALWVTSVLLVMALIALMWVAALAKRPVDRPSGARAKVGGSNPIEAHQRRNSDEDS